MATLAAVTQLCQLMPPIDISTFLCPGNDPLQTSAPWLALGQENFKDSMLAGQPAAWTQLQCVGLHHGIKVGPGGSRQCLTSLR